MKDRAQAKLRAKHLDLIVANPIGGEGAGFAAPTNEGWLFFQDGSEMAIPRCSKAEFARVLVDEVTQLLEGKRSE